MIYALHHSKGTLLVSAEDREQVVRWSERQLGKRAGLVSITEGLCKEADPSVEKDGTGISTMEVDGCHSVSSIMAKLAQDVHPEQGRSTYHDESEAHATWRVKETTWH